MSKAVIGGRRSAIEILYEMLSVTRKGGVNKTAIMYLSNLSYDQLLRYLSFLSAHGLLEKDDASGHYRITARGIDTLDQVSGVLTLLRDLQIRQEVPVEDLVDAAVVAR